MKKRVTFPEDEALTVFAPGDPLEKYEEAYEASLLFIGSRNHERAATILQRFLKPHLLALMMHNDAETEMQEEIEATLELQAIELDNIREEKEEKLAELHLEWEDELRELQQQDMQRLQQERTFRYETMEEIDGLQKEYFAVKDEHHQWQVKVHEEKQRAKKIAKVGKLQKTQWKQVRLLNEVKQEVENLQYQLDKVDKDSDAVSEQNQKLLTSIQEVSQVLNQQGLSKETLPEKSKIDPPEQKAKADPPGEMANNKEKSKPSNKADIKDVLSKVNKEVAAEDEASSVASSTKAKPKRSDKSGMEDVTNTYAKVSAADEASTASSVEKKSKPISKKGMEDVSEVSVSDPKARQGRRASRVGLSKGIKRAVTLPTDLKKKERQQEMTKVIPEVSAGDEASAASSEEKNSKQKNKMEDVSEVSVTDPEPKSRRRRSSRVGIPKSIKRAVTLPAVLTKGHGKKSKERSKPMEDISELSASGQGADVAPSTRRQRPPLEDISEVADTTRKVEATTRRTRRASTGMEDIATVSASAQRAEAARRKRLSKTSVRRTTSSASNDSSTAKEKQQSVGDARRRPTFLLNRMQGYVHLESKTSAASQQLMDRRNRFAHAKEFSSKELLSVRSTRLAQRQLHRTTGQFRLQV